MCEGVRICFSFTQAVLWFAMNSNSRISPTTGRSQRIAYNPNSSGSDSLVGDK